MEGQNLNKELDSVLKEILGEDAYNFGNMQVSSQVQKLSKAIYYIGGQLPIIKQDIEDEQNKEYINKVFKKLIEILKTK